MDLSKCELNLISHSFFFLHLVVPLGGVGDMIVQEMNKDEENRPQGIKENKMTRHD